MNALLILALLSIAAAGLALALRCGAEESYVLLALGLIAAGYLLALTGLLPFAGLLLWLAALAGAGFIAYTLVKKRWRDLLPLLGGIALFCAAGLFLWWMCRGCTFTDWDDFSHWGSSLKITCTTGALYTAPASPDGFKSYPPASVLWQFLLMKSSGVVFREDLALFFHGLLQAILLLYPLKAIRPERIGSKALAFGALFFLPQMIYPRGIYMLGVDVLLGIFWALILLAEFLPGRNRVSAAVEILGCFALTLVKSSGFGLAMMTAAAVLIYRICISIRARHSLRGWAFELAAPVGMMLACLLAKFSWAAHLTAMGAAERWHISEPLWGGLMQMLHGDAPAYRYTVAELFRESIFGYKNYGTAVAFPFAGWFAVLLILGLLAVLLWPREHRGSIAGGLASALVIGAAYTASLLLTYLFMFNEGEALALASISRYLATCIVFMAVCGTAFLVTAIAQHKLPVRLLNVLVLAAALTLISHPKYLVTAFKEAPLHAAQSNHDAYLSRRAALRIRSLGEENPRLYLITANDAGITELRVRYELLPDTIPQAGTILMAQPDPESPWATQRTWQEWRSELLENFDYVYIYCPEIQFVNDYLPVFIDKSQAAVDKMFRVVDTGEDAILENMPGITADPEPAV